MTVKNGIKGFFGFCFEIPGSLSLSPSPFSSHWLQSVLIFSHIHINGLEAVWLNSNTNTSLLLLSKHYMISTC